MAARAGILWPCVPQVPSMTYEALLTQVFAAITIAVLLTLLYMMVKKRTRRGRRRRRIQRRRAAPINAYYYCAHCATRTLHGSRTREAWKAGSRRFFCDTCKPLREHEAQETSFDASSLWPTSEFDLRRAEEQDEDDLLNRPRPPARSGKPG